MPARAKKSKEPVFYLISEDYAGAFAFLKSDTLLNRAWRKNWGSRLVDAIEATCIGFIISICASLLFVVLFCQPVSATECKTAKEFAKIDDAKFLSFGDLIIVGRAEGKVELGSLRANMAFMRANEELPPTYDASFIPTYDASIIRVRILVSVKGGDYLVGKTIDVLDIDPLGNPPRRRPLRFVDHSDDPESFRQYLYMLDTIKKARHLYVNPRWSG